MKVGIIGCGVMGKAIAKIAANHHEVYLHDHRRENAEPLAKEIGAKVCLDATELVKEVDAVILAIKPQILKDVSKPIAGSFSKDQLVLSILSGASIKTLEENFPTANVFRVMPNLPLLCGKGMIGIADDPKVDTSIKKRAEEALKGLGTISWLKESLMNGFTALTGSNPAFIYMIIEAMVEAGVTLGFKSDDALEYVLGTFEGSLELLRHTGSQPTKLKMQITSPGGTTIAGLNEFEAKGVRAGIVSGLIRCFERAEEMGAE